MVTGSVPAREKEWKRARGLSPSSFAFSALMISTAEAPSLICELLPAVILPSSLKAGRKAGQRLGRGAVADALVHVHHQLVALVVREGTGMISFLKRPSFVACSASCCERAPKASRSSRVRPYSSAIMSAPMPWGWRPGSLVSLRHLRGEGKVHPLHHRSTLGTLVMISTPAATAMS